MVDLAAHQTNRQVAAVFRSSKLTCVNPKNQDKKLTSANPKNQGEAAQFRQKQNRCSSA
jgi:hypothetical protein